MIRQASRELERLESQGAPTPQLGLFAVNARDETTQLAAQEEAATLAALQTAVAALDPDTLSPREALDALYQLKHLLN